MTVTWKKPSDNNCNVFMYTLYLRELGSSTMEDRWEVSNNFTDGVTSYNLLLEYSKEYEIIVSARNKLGERKSKKWMLKTAHGRPPALITVAVI